MKGCDQFLALGRKIVDVAWVIEKKNSEKLICPNNLAIPTPLPTHSF